MLETFIIIAKEMTKRQQIGCYSWFLFATQFCLDCFVAFSRQYDLTWFCSNHITYAQNISNESFTEYMFNYFTMVGISFIATVFI